ncbi:MAG: tripartite tricarboxylate transporter substrate binding protein [Usitatibacteraceae bacterium]
MIRLTAWEENRMTIRGFSYGRQLLHVFAVCALTFGTLDAASAQDKYPSKPITIIVPYPPGGSNDSFARVIGRKLGEALQQPVLIDNRPGAGGSIGTAMVAKAANDGYTLAVVSSSFVTNSAIQQNLPFDAIKSFSPVAMLATGPFIIAVRENLPVKSMPELLALIRSQPGKLNYASSGPGSINQFATEIFKATAGLEITHVPYRGMSPATMDLIGGHVDLLIASGPSLLPTVRSGKVRAIGITSPGTSRVAPELMPVAKSVPGYSFELWWGVLAPASTPPAVVGRLNAEINKILAGSDMEEFFLREGAVSSIVSPTQFAEIISRDLTQFQKIAKQASIKAD